MEFVFVGKKNVLSDALKERAEEKLSRVEHLLPASTKMTVTFSAVRELQKIEVTAPLGKRTLRATSTDKDMYAAIDKVVDIVEGQVVKYKSRLKGKSKGNKKNIKTNTNYTASLNPSCLPFAFPDADEGQNHAL